MSQGNEEVMKYAHHLMWLSLGVSAACSDTSATDSSNASRDPQGSNHSGKPNNPNQQGNAEVVTQGASLFQGSGTSGAGEALGAEIPPSTAHDCVPVGVSITNPGSGPATVTCFFEQQEDDTLAATLERRLEVVDDKNWLHLRLTFNPHFVDNSYGETAIGWGQSAEDATPPEPGAAPQPGAPPAPTAPKAKPKKGKHGHTFKDLVGSDHAEFQLFNGAGDLTMQFKLDYIEPTDATDSGYACAGVTGGDGKMIVGEADWILGATSSLDRNLNGCGLGAYVVDSPATDEFYTPNPDAPAWDFRVVYEVWVAEDPFGDSGFGDARIEYVHASPSKYDDNTLIVVPGDCPDTPPADAPDAAVPPPVTSEPNDPTPPVVDAGSDASPVLPPPMAR